MNDRNDRKNLSGFTTENYIERNRMPSFRSLLLGSIDERNMKDSEAYKKALITRQVFNKIVNDAKYHPGKDTVVQLALALEMDLQEAEMLLESAGYAFDRSSDRDLLVISCFERGIHRLMEVQLKLDKHGHKPFGKSPNRA
jgi:hypothetical protein